MSAKLVRSWTPSFAKIVLQMEFDGVNVMEFRFPETTAYGPTAGTRIKFGQLAPNVAFYDGRPLPVAFAVRATGIHFSHRDVALGDPRIQSVLHAIETN